MKLTKENSELCGGQSQIVPEFFKCQPVAEKVEEGKPKVYKAKIGQADKANQNRRIYPKEVWQANIESLKGTIAKNGLIGSVDHSWGGNLKEACLIWQDLWMEADGSVMGKFVNLEQHSIGKDFQVQLDAKMDVGFSTVGYGSGHEPSDAERAKYGLSEFDDVVVMDPNYELKKIDAVDDPSVEDARRREQRENEERQSAMLISEIKTIVDLQTKAPELHKLHVAAVGEAVKTAVKPYAEAINKLLPALKGLEGVELPQREVLPAENAKRVTDLEAAVAEAKTASTKLATEKGELQTKIDAFEAEKKDLERQTKVKTKLEAALKDKDGKAIDFADLIRDAANLQLSSAAFDDTKVEAFVAGQSKFLADLAKKVGTKPPTGLQGDDVPSEELEEDEELAEGEDEQTDQVLENAKSGLEKYAKSKTKK